MIKKYSLLSSNTTLEFNKTPERQIASVIAFKTMKTSWFFMILMLLGTTINHKATANNKTELVYTSSYTYHTVILKPLVAHGHSGGGGHGDALFSPTDHDKPNCPRDKITYTTTNKILHYNNTITSTNIKIYQS